MERDARLLAVRDFMNPKVRWLDLDMPIEDALLQLRKWGYSGAPVVKDGTCIGVLSERDAMAVLAQAAYHAIPEGTVGDHMTTDVDVLTPGQDIFLATQRFRDTHHRRFPVVENGRLVGIVTVRDIDQALWDITQQRRKHRRGGTPGAAWDETKSRARDRNRS